MIALDTNVLVRFLVEDDPVQTERAAAVMRAAIARDEALFVPELVLVETVWVLRRSYRVEREEVVRTLRRLFAARHLRFRSSDSLHRALAAFASGRGDFADYVIREQAAEAGCHHVVTFDQALSAEPCFEAP